MMKTNILVIGGNGLIGKVILRILKDRNPYYNLFVGGRQAAKTDNDLFIDVNNIGTFKCILEHKIDLIVICTKDTNNAILRFALHNKLDYIDITKPTPDLIPSYNIATSYLPGAESRIVFSSGWMAGIVGSLVAFAEPETNAVQSVGIYIYYSVKDMAGKSSAHFLAENICKPFVVYKDNHPQMVKHFLNSEVFNFSFGIGSRQVYNLDIPDLFILNQIEMVPTVSVKMTYNSKIITHLMGYFQYFKVFNVLSVRERKWLFGSSGNGDQTIFELLIKTSEKTRKLSLQSINGQSELTAFSTVLHIEKMLSETLSGGVYFSNQLHNPVDLYDALNNCTGINIKISA